MAEKTKDNKPNLFSIFTALFNNKEYINNLTPETLRQNCFMINRRVAIKYPLQAQVMNNTKINSVDVVKFWSDFLYTGSKPPGWSYTAGANKSSAAKFEKEKITPALIKFYCDLKYISPRDFAAAIRFFPEETYNEIIDLEQLYKGKDNSNESSN